MYARVRKAELKNKDNLLEYQEEKPGMINRDNVNDIIAALRRRKQGQWLMRVVYLSLKTEQGR